jgi:DnaK suppressor protein
MDQRQGSDEPLDLDRVRKTLASRLDELRSRGTELKRPPEQGSTIGFGKRIGEGTSEAIGRLTDVGVAGSLDATEARIVRAIEKLDDGTYGRCDVCGQQIPLPRLRAAPESSLCIDHARAVQR